MYINDDYLMHFGVKGMHWGIRHERETGSIGATSGKHLGKTILRRAGIGAGTAASIAGAYVYSKKAKTKQRAEDDEKRISPDYRKSLNANGRYKALDYATKPGKDGKPSPLEKTSSAMARSAESIGSTIKAGKRLSQNNYKSEDVTKLSDDELRKRTDRLRLETNYLTAKEQRSAKESGEAKFNDIMAVVGGTLATTAALTTVAANVHNIRSAYNTGRQLDI